ncbi:ankyrin repeat domain-containing protein [Armatimonas rosea]|uniref:Ankyrin repeat protein n=1 Tax=Armatimonas rosea TaxID=685828 RepID=A0A7W9SVB8_ARMRO|nr:ankyrin repeat domain-containing protein [Armatimonas rosea]MBB6052619.1 ankyrin repeat protein [Armatimonas rosea]
MIEKDHNHISIAVKSLIDHLRSGDIGAFFAIVAEHPEAVYGRTELGVCPLNVAINFERDAVVDFLLERGVELNPLNDYTPLMTALSRSKFESAKKLLKHGARLDITDEQGRTAWSICASNGNREALLFLVENSPELLDALAFAYVGEQEQAIEFLQSEAASGYLEQHGGTLLLYCCELRLERLFEYLVESGAALDFIHPQTKNTLLHLAAGACPLSFVQAILPHVRLNARNDVGQTALIIAAADNNCEVVSFLLQNKASTRLRDWRKLSALDYAHMANCPRCIESLLKK